MGREQTEGAWDQINRRAKKPWSEFITLNRKSGAHNGMGALARARGIAPPVAGGHKSREEAIQSKSGGIFHAGQKKSV